MSGNKTIDVDFEPCEAFSFDNVARNLALVECGMKPPKYTSTGTTIVGCVYKVCSSIVLILIYFINLFVIGWSCYGC